MEDTDYHGEKSRLARKQIQIITDRRARVKNGGREDPPGLVHHKPVYGELTKFKLLNKIKIDKIKNMGRINRTTIDKNVKGKLEKKLWKTLSSFDSPAQTQAFLGKFLTSSEILILAKRLEIFKMVIEKKPYETIMDRLKVGSSSISRAQNTLRKYGSSFENQILKPLL